MPHHQVIDELTYLSYRANRTRAPHVAVERWRMVYADVDIDAFEARYQTELAKERESCQPQENEPKP